MAEFLSVMAAITGAMAAVVDRIIARDQRHALAGITTLGHVNG